MKKLNFSVKLRPRESAERLIRRFIKKAKKEKIVEKYRARQRYEKPSVRRKLKSEKAWKIKKTYGKNFKIGKIKRRGS